MKVWVVEWADSPSDHDMLGVYADWRTAIRAIRARGGKRLLQRSGKRTFYWRDDRGTDYYLERCEVETGGG